MEKIQQIKFQNKKYLLIGETEGAICTKKQYINGELSYAHLFEDGTIRRFMHQIGTIKDIEFLGVVNIKVKKDAIFNMFNNYGKLLRQ